METLSLGTFSEDGFMISSTPTVLWEVHNFLFCVRQTRTCRDRQRMVTFHHRAVACGRCCMNLLQTHRQ